MIDKKPSTRNFVYRSFEQLSQFICEYMKKFAAGGAFFSFNQFFSSINNIASHELSNIIWDGLWCERKQRKEEKNVERSIVYIAEVPKIHRQNFTKK